MSLMPSFITPIEQTRSFSLKPARGLRYGNFEGYVHLPPVVNTSKLGAHSFSSLNNQQIYKAVCEWFDAWRTWQQKVLLCGIVNRCSLRQVDILATTLEPLRHRDYTVAVQHHYPRTPLKKIRDNTEKKKKRKRNLKRPKAVSKDTKSTDSKGLASVAKETDLVPRESNAGDATEGMGDVADREGDDTAWEGDITDRTGDVTDRTGDVTDRTGDITDRTRDFTDRTGDITDRTGDITDRTGDVTDRTGDFTDRTGDVTDRTGDLTDRTGDVTDRMGDVTDRMGDIIERADSPVSVIDSDDGELDVMERAARKMESYLLGTNPLADKLDNFADNLAGQIISDSITQTDTQPAVGPDQYAENLASSILKDAMDIMYSDLVTQVDHATNTEQTVDSQPTVGQTDLEMIPEVVQPVSEELPEEPEIKQASSGEPLPEPEVKQAPDEPEEKQTPSAPEEEAILKPRPWSPIVDVLIEPKSDDEQMESLSGSKKKKSDRPLSLVRIITPGEKKSVVSKENFNKRIQSGNSAISRSLSAFSRSSVSKLRYSLFGSTAVSTPDFFPKHSKDEHGPGGPGPMQRELRQGKSHQPIRLQNMPVPGNKLYKSVRWWPNSPRDGKIFLKAQKQDLTANFQDQLLQVWNWMELWEDYERIALLKDLLKISGPEHLGFLSSHIQQQLRDTRDVNRMSDRLLLYIFSYLSAEEIRVISKVCRRWRFLCATDDLWMLKCRELGIEEGIHNLEGMILKSNKRKMGIDWRLAYEELRRITQMMRLNYSKGKGKKKSKSVNFKDQLRMLQDKEAKQPAQSGMTSTPTWTKRVSSVSESDSFSDTSSEPLPRFHFRNQVTVQSQSRPESVDREELHRLLKRILFMPKEGTKKTLSKSSGQGDPVIVELEVHRGTWSAVHKKDGDDDNRSIVSEDLMQFDDEYKIKQEEIPEPKPSSRLRRDTSRVSTTGPVEIIDTNTKPKETLSYMERVKRMQTGVINLKPSILRKKVEMKDDADAEDAAYDIRPELMPAPDILGKAKPQMSLQWHRKKKKVEEDEDNDSEPEMQFAGLVKSVLRARKLQGHMNGILGVQFDHRRLLSAGADRVIRMWDIRSGRSIHKFYGHKGGIRCLQYLGNELATGSWDTTIMIWDLRNLCRKYILTDHTDSVSCLQLNADYLVSGSHDKTVRVWNRRTYMSNTVIVGHTGSVTCLAFDGFTVASGATDKTIRLSNLQTGQCLHVCHGCQDPILSVLMKGSLVISSDQQGRVHFWNKSSGQCEAAIQAHQEPVHKLAFLEGRFFTASGDGTIREWDLVTMTSVRLLQGHKGPVRDIKVSHNRIVSCSDDGSIRIWDLFDPRKKLPEEVQLQQLQQE